MHKWEQTTLHTVGDLVGDPTDHSRTRYHFEDPPHAFTYTEPMIPMNFYMVLDSDPWTYEKVVRNFLWEVSMQEEYNSLLKNQNLDMVSLPSDGKIVR
jgi:hypothetical protein